MSQLYDILLNMEQNHLLRVELLSYVVDLDERALYNEILDLICGAMSYTPSEHVTARAIGIKWFYRYGNLSTEHHRRIANCIVDTIEAGIALVICAAKHNYLFTIRDPKTFNKVTLELLERALRSWYDFQLRKRQRLAAELPELSDASTTGRGMSSEVEPGKYGAIDREP